jgi:hypothetical protein
MLPPQPEKRTAPIAVIAAIENFISISLAHPPATNTTKRI